MFDLRLFWDQRPLRTPLNVTDQRSGDNFTECILLSHESCPHEAKGLCNRGFVLFVFAVAVLLTKPFYIPDHRNGYNNR